MKIRFCEFCSKVVQGSEEEYCAVCGCRLGQDVEEAEFNAPGSKWPFDPVEEITIRVQGQDRLIRFEGTHSVYHLWKELHRAYSDMNLWFRERAKDEMEFATFPADRVQKGFRLLEPGDILNCGYRRFSLHTYAEPDPELTLPGDALEITYQGTFDLVECPKREIPYLLGWMLATIPRPGLDQGWVFEI